MNKDDMSDDEQFDAFLKGEDELSRALQGIEQPEPSPELDAVIMKRVRFAHAQRTREAANDPVDGEAPQLATGTGKRWRVPVGIAASVLAGVFATQLYEGDRARRERPVLAEESAVVYMPQEMAAPPQAPPAEIQMAPAPPPKAAVMKPVEEARAIAGAVAANRGAAMDSVRPPPPPPELAEIAPAPAPAPAMERAARQKVEVTGSSIRRVDGVEPGAWLRKVQALLEEGKDAEALAEWEKFKKLNPEYPVPDATVEKIKEIAR